nr:hypothetical protein [uncultured Dongia sp.]
MTWLKIAGSAVIIVVVAWSDVADQSPSDAQIRQALIERSIASYPGRRPCPYNLAKNGSRCGGRSAWSKAGRYAPLCYQDDVSDAMIKAFMKENDLAQ